MSKKPQTKTERILYMRENQYGSLIPQRQEFATPAPHRITWKAGNYETGDGDHTAQVPRPGSCHKHIKSFGEST